MNWIRLKIGLGVLLLFCLSSGCDQVSTAASSRAPDPQLEARLKVVEELIPSQSHIMADVADHFANLWFAGKARNWPLADFYLSETRSHLRWAVRRIPIRKDNKEHDVNLTSILQAFENGQLTRLKETIAQNDEPGFERVYREALNVCYACHTATDKPYLRPQIPAQPPSRIINFDPSAKGPV